MSAQTKGVDVLQWLGDERHMYGVGTESRATCEAVYSAVAELIEENAAMKELLRVQDEAMSAYRELVEHRNRQIIVLGGEP